MNHELPEIKKGACAAPYHFPITFLPLCPYTIWQNYLNKLFPKVTTGVHFFDHWVQNDHGVFIFSDHGVQMPFGEGSKVTTPSADSRRFANRPKSRQGIPATANVPEPLVFSGFPDILFIPFVSIKRFTFPHKTRS